MERSHGVTSGQLPVLSDVENFVLKNFYCTKRFHLVVDILNFERFAWQIWTQLLNSAQPITVFLQNTASFRLVSLFKACSKWFTPSRPKTNDWRYKVKTIDVPLYYVQVNTIYFICWLSINLLSWRIPRSFQDDPGDS